jgi:hypothetical protein
MGVRKSRAAQHRRAETDSGLAWLQKQSGPSDDRDQSRSSRVAANSGSVEPHSLGQSEKPLETAMVPSWRLAEESQKRRDLQAKVKALEARISELKRIIKAGT